MFTSKVLKSKPIPNLEHFTEIIDKRISDSIQVPFSIELWNGSVYSYGCGKSQFKILIKNKTGLAILSSLDELHISEAYVNELIDFEGNILNLIALRKYLKDTHRLVRLWQIVMPFLTKTLRRNRKAIAVHYEYDNEFYFSFLDSSRSYSHAVFTFDNEPLEVAQKRKLELAIKACDLKQGDRVLDVGGGWGSFVELAGKKGIEVTSLTISKNSEIYIRELIDREKLPCRIENIDFLAYHEKHLYDAIVVLGVMEHLPDYQTVIQKFDRLLKPGGRVYLDASASSRKFDSSTFVSKYIFPGRHSFFCLHDFLTKVAKENFEVISVYNDRKNYLLTCKSWAENLDRRHDEIANRWGERLYRLFRIYLWASVFGFQSQDLTAYRVVLEKARSTTQLLPRNLETLDYKSLA